MTRLFSGSNLCLAAGAAALEAVLGYPDALFAAIRHPVVWFGAWLAWLERRLNRAAWPPGRRRAGGIVAVGLLIGLVLGAGTVLQAFLPAVLTIVVAATLLAQRSLGAHIARVAAALDHGGLAAGREAVSHVVGRDTSALDEAGVARAAIESLAENFSDGVVAPLFWGATAGLPGMMAYKAINTADSMIGHRTARYAAFGWAAARLDDAVNLPASRLAALLIVVAAAVGGADARGAWRTTWRDAGRHRSPNAGWPEAAMAGALGLRLAGPRVYGGVRVEDAWMGDGRPGATVADVRRALRLYWIACGLQLFCWATLALVIGRG